MSQTQEPQASNVFPIRMSAADRAAVDAEWRKIEDEMFGMLPPATAIADAEPRAATNPMEDPVIRALAHASQRASQSGLLALDEVRSMDSSGTPPTRKTPSAASHARVEAMNAVNRDAVARRSAPTPESSAPAPTKPPVETP